MWIRLKIGKIRFIEDEYALMYAMKNENKIKKQGDNLIDVLEDLDQIIQVTEQIENGVVDQTDYVIYLYQGIGVDRHKEKYVRTQNSVKLYEHHLLEVLESEDYREYFKIITYEQMMPLAQEVTNV